MAFALGVVGVGVNAKKVQAYVELDEASRTARLACDRPARQDVHHPASHGALAGLVARIGASARRSGCSSCGVTARRRGGRNVGENGEPTTGGFSCHSTDVSAIISNHNSRMEFTNFPIPRQNQIEADGVEVLFYCLRMGTSACSPRCPRGISVDDGDGRGVLRSSTSSCVLVVLVIKHELPSSTSASVLGGALQVLRACATSRSMQDADGVDLAGLRDLTKSAASGTAMESQAATEERPRRYCPFTPLSGSPTAAPTCTCSGWLGEDDLILMGMVKDVRVASPSVTWPACSASSRGGTSTVMAGTLETDRCRDPPHRPDGDPEAPGRVAKATARSAPERSFYRLVGDMDRPQPRGSMSRASRGPEPAADAVQVADATGAFLPSRSRACALGRRARAASSISFAGRTSASTSGSSWS